jgi:hypothetical protein
MLEGAHKLWNRSYAVIPLGAASPRTLISDLPGGFNECSSRLRAPGRHAAEAWLSARASLPIWSCSVWGLPCPRLYSRSGALLPHLFTLTTAWGSLLDWSRRRAVCFLWHWPSVGLEANVPDVIRHTALRSSDFPPPAILACARTPAATARSSCQEPVYRDRRSNALNRHPRRIHPDSKRRLFAASDAGRLILMFAFAALQLFRETP